MRYLVFIILLFFVSVAVKALGVEISEIAPQKINEQEEWFEFSVETGDEVNMNDWAIQNEKGTTKLFRDFADQLQFDQNAKIQNFSGSGSGGSINPILIFTILEKSYFYWNKSPLSLPNNGGTIKIIDGVGYVLDEITYEKTKSGTSGGIKYTEVLNRMRSEVFPLIFRDNGDPRSGHSQGKANKSLPTRSEDTVIYISEVGPQRTDGADFIELYVASSVFEKVNLKYLTLKHNGTKLWEIEDDFFVEQGDFITLYTSENRSELSFSSKKITKYTSEISGISAGSGTFEVILWSGTSREHVEDFLCYQSGTLSQAEQGRVNKNIITKNWDGSCVDISDQIKNESVARASFFTDSNTNSDWIRHFNGSPTVVNNLQNKSPEPVITIQGSGQISGVTPFSLNVTGEFSTDPDGDHDILGFDWKLNGVSFSDRENPAGIKIETVGDHGIELFIIDHSGASKSVDLLVTTRASGSAQGSFSEGRSIAQIFASKSSKNKNLEAEDESFFSDFLKTVPEEFWDMVEKEYEFEENLKTQRYDINFPQKKGLEEEVKIKYHSQLTARKKIQFHQRILAGGAKGIGHIFLD